MSGRFWPSHAMELRPSPDPGCQPETSAIRSPVPSSSQRSTIESDRVSIHVVKCVSGMSSAPKGATDPLWAAMAMAAIDVCVGRSGNSRRMASNAAATISSPFWVACPFPRWSAIGFELEVQIVSPVGVSATALTVVVPRSSPSRATVIGVSRLAEAAVSCRPAWPRHRRRMLRRGRSRPRRSSWPVGLTPERRFGPLPLPLPQLSWLREC